MHSSRACNLFVESNPASSPAGFLLSAAVGLGEGVRVGVEYSLHKDTTNRSTAQHSLQVSGHYWSNFAVRTLKAPVG